MKKTIATMLILIAVLSVMTFETGNAEQLDSTDVTPIYIRADGSIEPSTAPIQHEADIYSLTDNIQNYNLTIQRNNIILNGAGFNLQGPGENSNNLAAVSLTCTNVTVFNLTISDWNIGVLGVYDSNIIQSSKFADNHYDVAVYANNYLITGNQIGPQRIKGNNITVSKNQIALCDYQIGFGLTNCTGLKIESNNVTFSKLSAFFISPENSYFQIYHNNFLNVEVIEGGTLIFPEMDLPWDNGVEGNYWSDYKTRYPQVVEIDNSGIGNIAYVSNLSPKKVTDRYPLMEPYNYDSPVPPEIPELNWTILPILALTLVFMLFVKSKIKNKPLYNLRRNKLR